MSTPFKFAGLVGSLRENSFSKAVFNTLAETSSERIGFNHLDIGALPHYSEDLEKELPESVKQARHLIAESDAVIIISPEFNHGMPGVLKNALDWLSRPAFVSPMMGKHVIFLTISPGALGGVRAQYQLRETLTSMLCKMIPLPEIVIPAIHEKVRDGVLVDESTLEFIRIQLERLITAVQKDLD